MAEGETVQGNPVSVSYRFNVDHLKSGEFTLVIPVPTRIAELMGRVLIAWGAFDHRMNLLIRAMFRRPAEQEILDRIIKEALELQPKRNAVAHGYVKGKSVPDPSAPTGHSVIFYSVGEYRRQAFMVDLDEPTLDKLAHDIGHLGGNLMVVVQKLGGIMITENPEIVVVDEDFLSGQQTGSFRTLATTASPPSGPPSKE